MASFPAKPLLLFLLFLCCSVAQASYEELQLFFTGAAHSPRTIVATTPAPAPAPKHHKHKGGGHHHQPSLAPVHPPAHAPVHPPVKPPTLPPRAPLPPRKLVAVQGVVYCKHCMFVGVETLWKAKPLAGAVVKLTCNNTKYKPVEEEASTDKNGYFVIMAKKVTNMAFHKCRVTLVKSPSDQCSVPTNFKGGLKGAALIPDFKPPAKTWPAIYELFNVGPFAYEPSKNIKCAPLSLFY